jgi:hypothetical protein
MKPLPASIARTCGGGPCRGQHDDDVGPGAFPQPFRQRAAKASSAIKRMPERFS